MCARQGLTGRGEHCFSLSSDVCLRFSSLVALLSLFLGESSQSPWDHHCQHHPQLLLCLQSWGLTSPHLLPLWAPLLPRRHWRSVPVTAVFRGQGHLEVLGSSRRCQSFLNVNQKSCRSSQGSTKAFATKWLHHQNLPGSVILFFFQTISKDIF